MRFWSLPAPNVSRFIRSGRIEKNAPFGGNSVRPFAGRSFALRRDVRTGER